MSNSRLPPSPDSFQSWRDWARRFITFSTATPIKDVSEPRPAVLPHLIGTGNIGLERAGTAGILMYDPVKGTPVYSDGTAWVPFRPFQFGTAAVTSGAVTVNFPAAFSAPPSVFAMPLVAGGASGTAYTVHASSVTASSCVLRLRQIDNNPTPVTEPSGDVYWFAVL